MKTRKLETFQINYEKKQSQRMKTRKLETFQINYDIPPPSWQQSVNWPGIGNAKESP